MKKDKFDLIITLPLFNEEKTLPGLFESLHKSTLGCLHYYLVIVNHLSTDSSKDIIGSYRSHFHRVDVIEENYPLPCGGIPRNKGINYSITLCQKLGYQIPIATIDCDTEVPINFGDEIVKNIGIHDIVVFPERYKQASLLDWVSIQENQDSAVHALIGLNWLRYQILWALILSGIVETRGPGGYAMSAETFKLLRHRQPFDNNGLPITGENNRLGIIAHRLNLKVYASPFHTLVNPRREINSPGLDTTKGYYLNPNKAEVFKLARETHYPKLSTTNWSEYLRKGIWRTIRMVLIRAICYHHLNTLKSWMKNDIWQKILLLTDQFISLHPSSDREQEVVGSAFFTSMFEYVYKSITPTEQLSFISHVESSLPQVSALLYWSKNSTKILSPQSKLINHLQEKFEKHYSKFF